jgi:hypothetical protein
MASLGQFAGGAPQPALFRHFDALPTDKAMLATLAGAL